MFAPKQEVGEEISEVENEVVEILPEDIDEENPELSQAPIVIPQEDENNEMNEPFEVELENGETEMITLGDLSDSLQVNN